MTTTTQPAPQKVYVCECGHEGKVCGATHTPKSDQFAVHFRGHPDRGVGCCGNETACYVCSNCQQWARPHRTGNYLTGGAITWDCLNECAARGFAPTIRVPI